MSGITSHRDLVVWQMSMDLAVTVYKFAIRLPTSEKFGMWQQLTRAAASVPANIAEGNARGSLKEYAHFISIAGAP